MQIVLQKNKYTFYVDYIVVMIRDRMEQEDKNDTSVFLYCGYVYSLIILYIAHKRTHTYLCIVIIHNTETIESNDCWSSRKKNASVYRCRCISKKQIGQLDATTYTYNTIKKVSWLEKTRKTKEKEK